MLAVGPSPSSLLALPAPLRLRAQHLTDHQRVIEFLLALDDQGGIDIAATYHLEANSYEEAARLAHDAFTPYLSYLSFAADAPGIVHSVVTTDVNSSAVYTRYQAPYQLIKVDFGACNAWALPGDLVAAFSLYREATNTPSPYHAFLTLWKIAEFVFHKQRKQLDEKAKRVGVTPHRTPELFINGPYASKAYVDVVFRELKIPYRNALAHLTSSLAKTIDSYSDRVAIERELPFLKQIVRDILQNELKVWGDVRATNALRFEQDPVYACSFDRLSAREDQDNVR